MKTSGEPWDDFSGRVYHRPPEVVRMHDPHLNTLALGMDLTGGRCLMILLKSGVVIEDFLLLFVFFPIGCVYHRCLWLPALYADGIK